MEAVTLINPNGIINKLFQLLNVITLLAITKNYDIFQLNTALAVKISYKTIKGYVNIAKIGQINSVTNSFVAYYRSFIENDHRIWCF